MKEHVSNLLLSIVIPTKNRQEYALAAVESALRLSARNSEVEVIIRDCSDNDSLRGLLNSKFSDDGRYHYTYDPSKPSMTKNWDLAFSEACGLYVCGIGDDDAVLLNILDVVNYMVSNDIDCMRQPMIHYFWPGSFLDSYNSGKIVFPQRMAGAVWEIDLEKSYNSKIAACGFGYTHELPNAYHAIIKNSVLQEHRLLCGNIFNGTSLDAYSSFAFTKYIRVMAVTDFPFSIHGACPSSNTNRLNQKDKSLYKVHFDEFDDLKMPNFLPKLFSSEVSIAESAIVALQDTNRDHDIAKMNLAHVYGKSAALNLDMLVSLYAQYRIFQKPNRFAFGFSAAFRYYLTQRVRKASVGTCISLITRVSPSLVAYILNRFGNSNRVSCSNIREACLEVELGLPQNMSELCGASSDISLSQHKV